MLKLGELYNKMQSSKITKGKISNDVFMRRQSNFSSQKTSIKLDKIILLTEYWKMTRGR